MKYLNPKVVVLVAAVIFILINVVLSSCGSSSKVYSKSNSWMHQHRNEQPCSNNW